MKDKKDLKNGKWIWHIKMKNKKEWKMNMKNEKKNEK